MGFHLRSEKPGRRMGVGCGSPTRTNLNGTHRSIMMPVTINPAGPPLEIDVYTSVPFTFLTLQKPDPCASTAEARPMTTMEHARDKVLRVRVVMVAPCMMLSLTTVGGLGGELHMHVAHIHRGEAVRTKLRPASELAVGLRLIQRSL